jgi:hypothetical protein
MLSPAFYRVIQIGFGTETTCRLPLITCSLKPILGNDHRLISDKNLLANQPRRRRQADRPTGRQANRPTRRSNDEVIE